LKDQVELKILGQSLTVKCPDGEEPVREVASLLEDKIKEMRASAGAADSLRLMIYTAFKLAGDNITLKKQLDRLEDEIDSVTSGLLEIIE